ncbi:MAG: AIR synthase-related protein, partial [Candidatus Bathyarchaeota archaeon]|nr:AIR synthase-related protein [Candidatus Bathyarchaeota archaeon]
DFESTIISDVAPLNKLIMEILDVGGIVSMKDPTRGGLANTLNEWSEKSHVGIMVEEDRIPIREGVRAACEMLGIEALEIGNEGKVVVGVVAQKASNVLAAFRKTELGRDAEIIGEVTDEFTSVVMETSVGGKRIIPSPVGDPIPRIC